MINSKLYKFYLGEDTDNKGRYIQDIWKFSLEELELEHDYIQWLFPLKERSKYKLFAPRLNEDTIKVFKEDIRIKGYILESLRIMLNFYGLKLTDTNSCIEIIRGKKFEDRKAIWLGDKNHNYLRLTRVLKSLNTLGLTDYSLKLYIILLDIYNSNEGKCICRSTLDYWTDSIMFA